MRVKQAVPSWVMPGSIAGNVDFMSNMASGVSLCFFETKACLNYTEKDLPMRLADYRLHWHIHLPLDLPWENGAESVAEIINKLWRKAAFLHPETAVLHPPGHNAQELLQELSNYCNMRLKIPLNGEASSPWGIFAGGFDKQSRHCGLGNFIPKPQYCHIPILLENTPGSDIINLGGWPFLKQCGFGFCLDTGHALGYGQDSLLASDLPAKAALWHWHAPGDNDRHLPLTYLTKEQIKICRKLAGLASPEASHVLEIFNWQGILDSLPVMAAIFQEE